MPKMFGTLLLGFWIFVDKQPVFRKLVVPKAVVCVRPPNYFILLARHSRARSAQEATVLCFRAEHCRHVFRSAQALVVLNFQAALVAVMLHGEGACLIPRPETVTKLSDALSALGETLGLSIHTMHEDIFNAMHRI